MRRVAHSTRIIDSILGDGRGHREVASMGSSFSARATAPALAQESIVEKRWRQFFSDPTQWWDHRFDKTNARYPDFKHKRTHEALWIDSMSKPSWVEARLSVITPGTVQRNLYAWNMMLARHVKDRQYRKALDLFQQMQQEGMNPNKFTFIPLLNACASLRALGEGRHIHALIVQSGCSSDLFVATSLLGMYLKCGSFDDGWSVLKSMPKRDVVAWTAMIQGCVKSGNGRKAMEVFQQMQAEQVKPDNFTFVAVLNACASIPSLEEGRRVHAQVIQSGVESSLFVANSLVDMFAKCGSIEDAWTVFDKMAAKDLVAWNSIIQGYAKRGQGHRSLELFRQMQRELVEPNSVTYLAVVHAIASMGALEEGRQVHEQIIQSGVESTLLVGSSLVDMYLKCGSIEDARRVFNKLPRRDVVAWNTMIQGYVKCGQGQQALELFQQMAKELVKPDAVTFVGVLNACANIASLEEGRRIHEQLSQSGYESAALVENSLIGIYGKCGSIEDASKMFKSLPAHDVATLNTIIQGYGNCGHRQKVSELFGQMHGEKVQPDTYTYVGVVNACASTGSLEQGRQVHEKIIQCGFESDVFLGSSLIDMYAKCGSIEDAYKVFSRMPARDVVVWTAMIQGYVRCGKGQKALELFKQMCYEGMKPDQLTYVGALNACANLLALKEGTRIHADILESGLQVTSSVGSSLIDMYTKCGSVEHAWKVFQKIPSRDVVSFNAMIQGYVRCGQGKKALELFQQMQKEHTDPDTVTFVGALNACASIVALEEGKCLHAQIIRSGCQSNVFVSSGLIDMYAKCGSIEDACTVFNSTSTHDVVPWNALLGGYAMHGRAKDAVHLFDRMCAQGIQITRVTFVCLLSACSHAGLIDEGLQYFASMVPVYGITPTVEHYACVVDLLGRAGHIDEAEEMIKAMPCEPNVAVWKALLAACRVHGNVLVGERAARHVLQLDPTSASGYVLLSNIYAAAGRWDSTARVQNLMMERGVTKQPGLTWIEVNNQVHSFSVDDQSHSHTNEIHSKLKRLSQQLQDIGYVPDTSFVLHNVNEKEKIFRLWRHSEKLAIAYGLINTPDGTPLRIFKNLRVCGDCHTATKFIAKIVGREIIVRDANRFHHFKNGLCSCEDYW